MTLGERIKQIRLGQKLDRPSFAKILGVSKQAVYRYEKDGILPAPAKLIAIADRANIRLDWLLCGRGPKYRSSTDNCIEITDEEKTILDFVRSNGEYKTLFLSYVEAACAQKKLQSQQEIIQLPDR